MGNSDLIYYQRRLSEEMNEAERANTLEVQHVHLKLAQMYEQRIKALSGSTGVVALR